MPVKAFIFINPCRVDCDSLRVYLLSNAQNHAALQELLQIPRYATLLVGAGSSRFVGFPGWPQLLESLRAGVIGETAFPLGLDLLDQANFIFGEASRATDSIERLRTYHRIIRETFRPRAEGNHHQMHRHLVALPFAGIMTTNYDEVLESAVLVNRVRRDQDPTCLTIDCCTDPPPLTQEFIRSLSLPNPTPSVLHLHGLWKHPERCVLTRENFLDRYFVRKMVGDPQPFPPDKDLTWTPALRVLYHLLLSRPFVAVGFSLSDPVFVYLLELIRKDFDLALGEHANFAILPQPKEEDEKDTTELLVSLGVRPVYYPCPGDDHSALATLIADLATASTPQTAINTISEQLMRL